MLSWKQESSLVISPDSGWSLSLLVTYLHVVKLVLDKPDLITPLKEA